METKHTPGPWKFNACNEFEYEILGPDHVDIDNSQVIALVCASPNGDDETLANAEIITAVPALTSALDVCVASLTPIASWRLKAEMSGIGPDHTNRDMLLDIAITLARAALEQARKMKG